jgi:hypothetical protein
MSEAASTAAPSSRAVPAAPVRATAETLYRELAGRPLMPLAEVKEGMEGEAWTVFRGTTPEPFKVRVVAVLRSFLPKQDLVLVRALDPRVEHSGIVAGMSGSPVYIEGKLVGAIAYAWSFAKDPIGGVTPISSMLADAARPLRGPEGQPAEPPSPSIPEPQPGPEPMPPPQPLRGTRRDEARGPVAVAAAETHLSPVAVPLAVAGFPPHVLEEAASWLVPLGLTPWQGGGTGSLAGGGAVAGAAVAAGGAAMPSGPMAAGAGRAPGGRRSERPLVGPGSAIGVELVRGDLSAVAVGTVTTLLDGGARVLAFGHPMMNAGEMALPLVGAEIHTFLPSLSQSFKMASPLGSIGVLEQDRPSCIVGRVGPVADMIPFAATVAGPGGPSRTFHAEIARNRRLTPGLAAMVLAAAVADAAPDVTDLTATLVAHVALRGRPPLTLVDQLFSGDGLSSRALGSTKLVRALAELPGNPFGPVEIAGLEVSIELSFQHDVAEIVGVSLPGRPLHAGETVPLRVSLRPYGRPEYDEMWPVTLPRLATGSEIRIEVAGGAQVKPDLAPPDSLGGYLHNFAAGFPAKSAVVSVRTDAESLTLRGQLLPGLPSSALDTARASASARRAESLALVMRTPFPTSRVITGKREIVVPLAYDSLGRLAH